ncbi:MAG TPA: PGPGW domain-containing protein [Actinomycetes bacterium]|nr:PGPGW domain-containing protein [Actinomycetes bacterium]
MSDQRDVVKRHARRLAVTVAGAVVIFVGALLLVLPGPGLLVIVAGLAILATEYRWARRLLARARETTRRTIDRARARPSGRQRVTPPPGSDDRDAAA